MGKLIHRLLAVVLTGALVSCFEQVNVPVGDLSMPSDDGVDLSTPPEGCLDGVRNGDETDTDCGGRQCAKCAIGGRCAEDSDCITNRCTAESCSAARGFEESSVLDLEGNPGPVGAGRITADTQLDLVVSLLREGNAASGKLLVLEGMGSGRFARAAAIDGGPEPVTMVVVDLNGDNRDDVVASETAGGVWGPGLLSYTNDGRGSFLRPMLVRAGNRPSGVAVADFNRDGKIDAALSDSAASQFFVFTGRGDGGWDSVQQFNAAASPSIIGGLLGDDLLVDLFIGAVRGTTATLFRGDGMGRFEMSQMHSLVSPPSFVGLADFNGDGKVDLAAAGEQTLGVALRNGAGFAQPVQTALGAPQGISAAALASGDFDGDGLADIAILSGGRFLARDGGLQFGALDVLLGRVDGQLVLQQSLPLRDLPIGIAAGDWDGDGRVDLAVVARGSRAVHVYLNRF